MIEKRLWTYIDSYYSELLGDIYPQPPDVGHTQLALHVINNWVTKLTTCKTVLDVGCGEAFLQVQFESLGLYYEGVTMGEDYYNAKKLSFNVQLADFNFLPYPNESFDLVFSRHSLEHSPFPLLTLFEWYRVSNAWLCLIIPNPVYWTWKGKNHYGMMALEQAKFLLERAKWHIMWEDLDDEREFRFMCEKVR